MKIFSILLTGLALQSLVCQSALAMDQRGLPTGWVQIDKAAIVGNFRADKDLDKAVLVTNKAKNQFGIAIIPDAQSSQRSIIAKTFRDIAANPPELNLIKPGDYKLVCHDGGECGSKKILRQAIGVCFGEASCEIIYFEKGRMREIFTTD